MPRVATCTMGKGRDYLIDGSKHFIFYRHCAPQFEFLDRLIINGFFTHTMKNYLAAAITI